MKKSKSTDCTVLLLVLAYVCHPQKKMNDLCFRLGRSNKKSSRCATTVFLELSYL